MDEGRIVEHHYGDIVLFNVYFPNGQKDEERLTYKLGFYDNFLNYCQKLRSEGKRSLFAETSTPLTARSILKTKNQMKRLPDFSILSVNGLINSLSADTSIPSVICMGINKISTAGGRTALVPEPKTSDGGSIISLSPRI